MSITSLQNKCKHLQNHHSTLTFWRQGCPHPKNVLEKVLDSPPESCTVAHLYLWPPWRTASREKISLRINNVLHYHLKYFKFRFNLQLIGSVETWIFFFLNTQKISSVLTSSPVLNVRLHWHDYAASHLAPGLLLTRSVHLKSSADIWLLSSVGARGSRSDNTVIKHAINILTPCQLDPSPTFPFNDFLELVLFTFVNWVRENAVLALCVA